MSYLGIVHTLSQHNLSALLLGTQHTYAWRVYGKGTKPYWFHNTAHYKEPYFNSLHFPNLFTSLHSWHHLTFYPLRHRFITYVNEKHFTKPTFAAFIKLMDNYVAPVRNSNFKLHPINYARHALLLLMPE